MLKPQQIKTFISQLASNLDIGLGLRAPHYAHILECKPQISWFEAISENYMGISGGVGARPLAILEKIRADYPIVLHGVSMSIGSIDRLDFEYLGRLKNLIQAIEPNWVSDHICWTGVQGENLHDLLPLPYTAEVLQHLSEKIVKAQDFLGRQLVFENVSAYLSFAHSEMTEWEFISELSHRTGCGLLLDVNNVYVSSINQGFNPLEFLNGIPRDKVKQMHLAGHTQTARSLIDTHDAPVCEDVWDLYREALHIFGYVPTLIEWDDKIPEFSVLEAEADRARSFWEVPHERTTQVSAFA